MSDQTPTSPPPGPGEPTPDATVEQPAATDTGTTATSGGSGKKVALGIGAVVAVAAIGGGAFAWTQLSGGGPQPHDVLPADTIGYVRVDLDPSASQKVDLFRLAQRVPDLSRELGIEDDGDDLRRLFLEDALGSCDDVNYERDVEPWIGDRLGVGFGPDLDSDSAPFRFAVQVKDEDAAKTGITKIAACDDQEVGVAFLDGYAVVAPTQKSADAAVKAAETKPLADDADFARDQDALDEQGVLSGWVDLEGFVDAFEESEAGQAATEALGADAEQLTAVADETSSIAFSLSATSTSLSLDGVARRGDEAVDVPEIRGLGALPADTVVGLTVAGGGERVAKDWDQIKSSLGDLLELGPLVGLPTSGAPAATPEFDADAYAADPEGYEEEYLAQLEEQSSVGGDVDATLEQVEETLDVSLPADLETLLGDALSLYVGPQGLEDLAGDGPGDPSDIGVGLVMEGDEAKASDLAGRLVGTVQRLAGLELTTADGSDAVSLATNQEVADTLVEDGKLGDSEVFDSVVREDGEGGGLFVDMGAILDAFAKGDPSLEDDSTFKGLRNIEAVGASTTRPSDGYSGFSLSVAFTQAD